MYMGFLLALADFAKAALPEPTKKGSDSADTPRAESPVTPSSPKKEEDAVEGGPPLHVSVYMTSAYVILVEDADDWNSRSLILKVILAIGAAFLIFVTLTILTGYCSHWCCFPDICDFDHLDRVL